MTIRLAAQVQDWTQRADAFLATRDLTRQQITTGRDAWTVAHACGFPTEAYAISRDIVDAHIQTALAQIFPAAVFKDAKRY